MSHGNNAEQPTQEELNDIYDELRQDEEAKYEHLNNQNTNKMITSIVTNVSSNGGYESQHGYIHTFEYTFEDGTVGIAGHKTDQAKYKVGDSTSFTSVVTPHGLKITFVKADFNGSTQQSKPNNKPQGDSMAAGTCCSYSKDLEVAFIMSGVGEFDEARFTKNADYMLNWLNEKSK